MEDRVNLQVLFKKLKKRFGLIMLITILAVIGSGLYSYFVITPIYQSSTQILVNQNNQEVATPNNTQDIQKDLQLINTYNVIIKSRVILSKVIDDLQLNISVRELNNKISVSNVQNSQVITVVVNDPSPEKAVEIANTITAVFEKDIKNMMNVDNVSVLSPADMEEVQSPIKPSPKLNMMLAALIGLIIGGSVALLLEHLDTTVKTEQDIEELLGTPIIGLVSPIPEKGFTRIERRRKRRKK